MTTIAGLINLFDFEPGSRIGTAKTDGRIIRDDFYYTLALFFKKGEQCEVIEDTVYRLRDGHSVSITRPAAQSRLVHKAGNDLSSTECVSRSTWRTERWAGSGNKSLVESRTAWPFPGDMPGPSLSQAVLMDKFEKEAQDDARYNAVPSRFVSSKIEHF